jgi:large subunit ribosomal protein L31e
VIILSEEEELSRVYTINLAKVLLSPANRRTKRAINMIKEFATRHMKAEEIKIDEELNKQMWKRGIRHPPRKIRVKMVKDEDDVVTVSPYSEEAKEEAVEEKPAAVEAAAPVAATAASQETVTEIAKPEPKLPEVEEKAEEVEVAEVKEKEKPKKEEEPEKIVLSEEDLAEIMAEEEGAEEEGAEEEDSKGKRKK